MPIINSKQVFRTSIFFIFLGVKTVPVIAQENFISGYIILLNKDTLRGLIDIREWSSLPSSINFKNDLQSSRQSISVNEISEFTGMNIRYFSALLEVETSPYLISELDTIATFRISKERVFVRELVRGQKALYGYTDRNNREYYYIKTESDFELLRHKRYYFNSLFQDQYGYQSKKLILENKAFLNQIARYLSDCKPVYGKLQSVKYDRKSLIGLFETYYQCNPSNKVKIFSKRENYKFEVGAILNTSVTTLVFGGSDFTANYPLRTNFMPASNIGFGISADVIYKNAKRDFTIGNELMYNNLTNRGEYSIIVSNNNYSKYTTQIDISIIRINNLIRLTKHFDQLQLSFCLGLYTNILINQRSTKIDEIRTPNLPDPTITKRNIEIFSKNLNAGVIAGLGLRYKRYGAEARYELGFDTSGPEELAGVGSSGQIRSLVFLISYKI